MDPKRVVVIGAGLGGLSAAYELMCRGWDVTVLEARNRVGGRVRTYTDEDGGSFFEAGGEFIGDEHQYWLHYAGLFNLPLSRIELYEGPVSPMLPNGHFNHAQARDLTAEMNSVVNSINEAARDVNLEAPEKTPSAKALDSQSMNDWLQQLGVSEMCRRALAMQLRANHGVDVTQISYFAFLLQVKAHGIDGYWDRTENYRCWGGADRLPKSFAAALGERVHLGSPVKRVEVSEREALVRTEQGREFVANEVILAVPGSMLGAIDFSPKLPSQWFPQMGQSIKFFFVLKRGMELRSGLNPYALLDDGFLQLLWEPTEGQRGDHMVFTGFSGGETAERIARLPERELAEACIKELNGLYPGFEKHVVRTRLKAWNKAQFTHAGYSCPRPGDITTNWPSVRQGIPRLTKVGEDAATPWWALMNGALHSGVRAAEMLALRYRK